MPLVFPVTKLNSTTLPLALPITPIPKSSGGSEYPFPCVVFSRTRLLCPTSHMPPHDSPGLLEPLRTALFSWTTVLNEVAGTKIPEPQFVETVMPSTRAPSEAATCTPWLRKRWMRPGPLTPTARCALVVIPTSPVVTAPPQPVTGSPLPVTVYPLSRSSTPGTANEKHGVPSATAHVTSPVN